MDKTGVAVIMALWERFNARRGEIRSIPGAASYGAIISTGAPPGGMVYLAAVETGDDDGAPAGMKALKIPAGNYAIFTHRGPLGKIRETMQAVYGGWVPQNKAILRKAPHLEIYDERFDANSESSEFDVCVPVK